MKKPASPNKTEKRAKRTPEEKTARKSEKKTGRATADLNEDRDDKKASQKKSLKTAAKQLQKELNSRMNEVVTRIRKETKAKLKEVVKEATRRLDGDTERMFEQALHTIVRHYDTVSQNFSGASKDDATTGAEQAARSGKKGQTLNKDGSLRKQRSGSTDASDAVDEAPATKPSGRKAAAATASNRKATVAKPTPAKRGPKPGTPATGARRGPKPRVQATVGATDISNAADSASTDEISA